MSDLVKRLRKNVMCGDAVIEEAASRIEKLETALLIALGMLSEAGISSAEKCELAYEHLLKSRSDA